VVRAAMLIPIYSTIIARIHQLAETKQSPEQAVINFVVTPGDCFSAYRRPHYYTDSSGENWPEPPWGSRWLPITIETGWEWKLQRAWSMEHGAWSMEQNPKSINRKSKRSEDPDRRVGRTQRFTQSSQRRVI